MKNQLKEKMDRNAASYGLEDAAAPQRPMAGAKWLFVTSC
jgi:hypothetical protein